MYPYLNNSSSIKVRKFSDIDDLQNCLYENIINDLVNKLNILPGGRTPQRLYEMLSVRQIKNLNFLISDDRMVQRDSNFSNYGYICKLLSIPESSIYPLSYYNEYKLNGIKSINDKILSLKNKKEIGFALLGIGGDCHTASLFPFKKINLKSDEPGFIIKNNNEDFKRFTLSYDFIMSAKKIIFLVIGIEKSIALKNLLFNKFNPLKYPAQQIINFHNDIEIYADNKALSLVKNDI